MSTKSSVAWGEDFHLYTEMGDENHVYLRLSGVDFAAYPGSVEVTIPRAIWEVIRERADTDLNAAFWTDEELALFVKGERAQRLKRYAEHQNECEPCRSGAGCGVRFFYTERETDAEDYLIEYWQGERTRQREIADRITAYRDGMKSK